MNVSLPPGVEKPLKIGRPRTIRTDRAREIFMSVLRQTCNVSEACRTAGFGRSAAYEWRHSDPVFNAEWLDAEDEAADRLEREAWRRGVEGIDKPISYKGVITASYKEYSDRMLEILLKAHRPEKFVEKIVSEIQGRGGGPVQTQEVNPRDIITGKLAGIAAKRIAG